MLQNYRFPKLMEQRVLTTRTLVSGYLIKVRSKSFITLKGRFLKRKTNTNTKSTYIIFQKIVTKKSQILALTTQFNGFRLAAKRRYPDVHVSSRLEKFDLVI